MVTLKLYSFIMLIHIASSSPQFGGLRGLTLGNVVKNAAGSAGSAAGAVIDDLADGLSIGGITPGNVVKNAAGTSGSVAGSAIDGVTGALGKLAGAFNLGSDESEAGSEEGAAGSEKGEAGSEKSAAGSEKGTKTDVAGALAKLAEAFNLGSEEGAAGSEKGAAGSEKGAAASEEGAAGSEEGAKTDVAAALAKLAEAFNLGSEKGAAASEEGAAGSEEGAKTDVAAALAKLAEAFNLGSEEGAAGSEEGVKTDVAGALAKLAEAFNLGSEEGGAGADKGATTDVAGALAKLTETVNLGAADSEEGAAIDVAGAAAKVAQGLTIGFGDYKALFNKNYIDAAEAEFRGNIFKKVAQSVKDHNELFKQGIEKFSLAINQFSDWTIGEYLNILGMDLSQIDDDDASPKTKRAAGACSSPEEKDWRDSGAVTPVKDQLNCSSCYAFSAVGALEAQFFLKNGKLDSLSEQQFVDCSSTFGNKGCNKGLIDSAFKYAEGEGIVTTDKYPYEGKDSTCHASPTTLKISGVGKVPKGSEENLLETVCNIGPVSAAVDASDEKFKNYHDGVYFNKDCNATNTNHAVLVVGYGFDETADLHYWIIKNSFGTLWGQKGYGKIARNEKNQCGIANVASYPIV